MSNMLKTPTLIVGAGPYGLSLASFLAWAGKEFIIVGKTMSLWREHTFDDLRLRSDKAASVIKHPADHYSFDRFAQAAGIDPGDLEGQLPVQYYRQYIDWCEAQFPFDVIQEHAVDIEQVDGIFVVRLESGQSIVAGRVIMATGIAHHLRIPAELTTGPEVIHSYDTARIQELEAKKVLVVGAGQSAAESIAVLRSNGNKVEWYTRTEPIYYSEPLNIPVWLFKLIIKLPAYLRFFPPGILNKLFSIFSATTITPNFKAPLADVQRWNALPDLEQYDLIVAATGYRYDISHMEFLSNGIRDSLQLRHQMPVVSSTMESSIPGLYFCGAITEQFYGPPMKFMVGSHYAAKKLSLQMA